MCCDERRNGHHFVRVHLVTKTKIEQYEQNQLVMWKMNKNVCFEAYEIHEPW